MLSGFGPNGDAAAEKKRRRRKRGRTIIGEACSKPARRRSGQCFLFTEAFGVCARKGCTVNGACGDDNECCSGRCGASGNCDNV